MTFKLTKAQRGEKASLLAALKAAHEAVEAAIATYQAALDGCAEFATQIGEEAQAAWDDRSERWQDSDKGTAAQEWLTAWSDFAPDEPEPPEDVSAEFDELPDEAAP